MWNQKLYKKQASLEYFTSKIVMYIMISYKAQKSNVITGTKLSSYVYYDYSMTIIVPYNINYLSTLMFGTLKVLSHDEVVCDIFQSSSHSNQSTILVPAVHNLWIIGSQSLLESW